MYLQPEEFFFFAQQRCARTHELTFSFALFHLLPRTLLFLDILWQRAIADA